MSAFAATATGKILFFISFVLKDLWNCTILISAFAATATECVGRIH
jgi:hypothetical protein